ncbi:hypothetical protein AB0M35_26135 [Micromonospora sp. NPDC051196]|uniref:hypothetical protein n=1 Tax=Micromonospora sp. NPDC051196 TaxID=3155281 RepID=UPI00341C623A
MDLSRRQVLAVAGLGALATLARTEITHRTPAVAAASDALVGTGVLPLVRDRIEINQEWADEFRAELAERQVAPGTTVCLVARKIVHAPNYTLKLARYPLVVVADSYDGRGGALDTTEYDTAGATAAPITLLAKQVVRARLVAAGQIGGTGESGAPGEDGEPSESGFENGRPVCYSHGGNGGRGGNGAPGEPGGNGGAIATYTIGVQGAVQIVNGPGPGGVGGVGGPGGAGGAGGGGCRPGRAGTPGMQGPTGPSGVAGAVSQTVLNEADWWRQVWVTLGAAVAEQWGDYRTRVGEYRFRTYLPGDAPSVREIARTEVGSALAIYALAAPAKFTASRARTLSGYLDNALTPIGLSYQQDLRPDFDFFENFITAYQGRRDALFQNTLALLLNVNSTADKSQLAAALRAHAAGMAAAAQKDYELAASKLNQANLVLDQARSKLATIQAELRKIIDDHRRDQAEIDFGDFVKGVVGVVGAVVSIVTAVASGGSSVAAYLAVIGLAASTASVAGEAASGIYVDVTDPASPKPTAEAKDNSGGLKDVFTGTVKLVDKGKALAELFAADGDDEFRAKERQLLIKAFDATFDVNMRIIDVEHAALAAESARLKWEVYKADALTLQNLQSGFEDDLEVLTRVARAVLRQFQTYVDHFIAYGYRRDRAFDLYTLSSPPQAPRFPFDYGYLHPDEEEYAYRALSNGDAGQGLELLEKYVTSLAQFEPAQLREEYDDYWTTLSFDGNVAVSITDPDTLQSLKGSGSTSFIVDLAEFLPHTELKIGRAEVALIGATTKPTHPWVQVELEHCGAATNQRRDGTLVTVDAPLRSEASPAQIVGINPDDLDESDKQVFWGRSPAARWRITITPQAATAAGLDLTNLTEIQLAVKYAYHNPTSSVQRDDQQ